MAREKEKVNWRFEYKRDNIFNIGTGAMAMFAIALEEAGIFDLEYAEIIPIIAAFYINVSALRFFVESDKYE